LNIGHEGGRFTKDGALGRRITVWQAVKGYRYSIDSILLAWFCRPMRQARAVDLGAGCGVIGLVLLARNVVDFVVSIELQWELAFLAARNARENPGLGRMDVVQADARGGCNALAAGRFDLVVCNPPYFSRCSGKASPNSSREIARNESYMPLDQLLIASKRLLCNGGRLCLVHRPEKLGRILGGASDMGLEPKRIRFVHPGKSEPANLFLLEATAGAKKGGLEIEPPLIIYGGRKNNYTKEVKDMLMGAGIFS